MSEVTEFSELSKNTQIKSSILKRGFLQGLKFAGPGTLVAVGYIDPGNFATDLASGSHAGYTLLSVILISSLIAMLLQIMCARLGIATGKDLAEMSREAWPQFAWPFWIITELSIIATDLAAVIGSAIALKLLFSVPIIIGVILTILDVFLILALDRFGFHLLEKLVAGLLLIITCGFFYELALAEPNIREVLLGFLPTPDIAFKPDNLYLAIGIVGATVMPHNLYLHSSLVIKRWPDSNKSEAASNATSNTLLSLTAAMFLNSALVVLAASAFHYKGNTHISEIMDAYHLFTPVLGSSAAAVIFAIMLLASGQGATITSTLAGQIVMAGFVRLQMKPWLRRLLTRSMALIPALVVILYFGEKKITHLMICSQVFLSLQLPFAMVSLLLLTSDAKRMGQLVNKTWMKVVAFVSAILIILTNLILIMQII